MQQDSMQRIASQGAALGFGLFTLLTIIFLFIGMAINNEALSYLAIAVMAFLLPLGAGLVGRGKFDPFEPINLVALAILFGTTLRSFWLFWSDSDQVGFIMMGTDFEAVLGNSLAMLMSIAALCAGYLSFSVRVRLERFSAIKKYALASNRIWISVAIGVVITAIGLMLMIATYGISLADGLFSQSLKRVQEYSDGAGGVVYSSGIERYIASFGGAIFVFYASLMLVGLIARSTASVGLLSFLLLVAVAGPFLTSSRSNIVLLMISLIIFAYYYGGLKARSVILVAAASFIVVATLGAIREENQTDLDREVSSIDRVFGSGNSLDLIRTSAIIDRVPEVRPHLNGTSYFALFAIPIPRSVWLEKPSVGLGAYVKGELFGERVRLAGWPSGMIAEGWMNFGYIGLILPMLIFGAILRITYESVRPMLGISFPVTLLYSAGIWRLGFGTIGLNFAHGIALTFTALVPVLVLVVAARAPRNAANQHSAIG